MFLLIFFVCVDYFGLVVRGISIVLKMSRRYWIVAIFSQCPPLRTLLRSKTSVIAYFPLGEFFRATRSENKNSAT